MFEPFLPHRGIWYRLDLSSIYAVTNAVDHKTLNVSEKPTKQWCTTQGAEV